MKSFYIWIAFQHRNMLIYTKLCEKLKNCVFEHILNNMSRRNRVLMYVFKLVTCLPMPPRACVAQTQLESGGKWDLKPRLLTRDCGRSQNHFCSIMPSSHLAWTDLEWTSWMSQFFLNLNHVRHAPVGNGASGCEDPGILGNDGAVVVKAGLSTSFRSFFSSCSCDFIVNCFSSARAVWAFLSFPAAFCRFLSFRRCRSCFCRACSTIPIYYGVSRVTATTTFEWNLLTLQSEF